MGSKTARDITSGFYDDVLSEANRTRLEGARELEGIDEEIALLRIRLRDLMAEDPGKTQLFYKGIDTLMKAVSTRYKLSPQSKDDLNDSIVGVLNGIGRELWPEGMP